MPWRTLRRVFGAPARLVSFNPVCRPSSPPRPPALRVRGWLWGRRRFKLGERGAQRVEAWGARKSVRFDGASDGRRHRGEFVVREVNCRHGLVIIGRHLSSKEIRRVDGGPCRSWPALLSPSPPSVRERGPGGYSEKIDRLNMPARVRRSLLTCIISGVARGRAKSAAYRSRS
jgi:hypothetical protein